MSIDKRKPMSKPWENNEPFIKFVKEYETKMFLQHMFNRITQDRNICWYIEEFVDDRRYINVLMPYLRAMFEKAKLHVNFDKRREGIWEVWYFMQQIAPFVDNNFPEEGKNLLKAISDELIPPIWLEYRSRKC